MLFRSDQADGKDGPYSVGLISTDDRSPGLAVPDDNPLSGIRSYFTIARVNRDLFRQSSVGVLYTDCECPSTGEYNRLGGVDTRLKFTPNWTLDGQAVTTSSNIVGNVSSPAYSANNCEANAYPFSSGNHGDNNHYAGPADRLELQRVGLHLSYDGTYTDITPGFVSIPGFINRVDIRETKQDIDYRFRPKHGWITDWGPSWVTRYDFDHTGLRLDTDYSPYLSIQGRGQTSIYLHPYEETRERLRPQDFCFYGYALYCSPPTLGDQDFHEHTSGASVSTGYFKFAKLQADYYWGDAINIVAAPAASAAAATPYTKPFVAREDDAGASLIVRPMKPLKIREHVSVRAPARNQRDLFLPAVGVSRRRTWHLQRPHPAQQMELAVHAATVAAPHPAIQRAARGYAWRGLALHLPAHREAIQRRLPRHLSGPSRYGDLCWLQQRPPESQRGRGNSPVARLRGPHRQGIHERQPPVVRESELYVPVLKRERRVSHCGRPHCAGARCAWLRAHAC